MGPHRYPVRSATLGNYMRNNLHLILSNTGINLSPVLIVLAMAFGMHSDSKASNTESNINHSGKPVIYQVMTRIFGNDKRINKAWGTKQENGVGKFADFTPQALAAIKQYGVTHVWYTGVLHHAVIGDYTKYGITNDDPDVVKGRAGSPYAVKDYYNVNPDLAVNPEQRLEEFQALIDRTHAAGMKVIIDIIPNHVARSYDSISAPKGIRRIGEDDDTSVEYHRDNNFYYIVGEAFQVPDPINNYRPLNGESHPLADGKFVEIPAKWTGNGARQAKPKHDDWYETVKINYGVKPDGSYDFDKLPAGYDKLSTKAHYAYWQHRDVPNSWVKFKDIALYWLDMGVDGFRYDMAGMVPVEFWSYLNSSIKHHNSNAVLIAEIYNPPVYRDYIYLGRMDYLYDKVDMYDGLKAIMQGKAPTSSLVPMIDSFADIDQYMLHFLENHDEQRIASPDFAGDARMGRPAMAVSALVGREANILFYGQALGEAGQGDAGFGDPTRTSIFDYWGLEHIQNWRNNGSYDGAKLTPEQKNLSDFYQKLLSISAQEPVLAEHYSDLHAYNLKTDSGYSEKQFSFARWGKSGQLIVVTNFSENSQSISLRIPNELAESWQLNTETQWLELLSENEFHLINRANEWQLMINLKAHDVLLLKRNIND